MIVMSQHIYFGVAKSAHSGAVYPEKRNGYVQRMRMASNHSHGVRSPWEDLGQYIKDNSTKKDDIYVWGWYPGIYVSAQRFSNTVYPFTSEMHTRSPESLSGMVQTILSAFEKKPPKFIVDSRKQHFPWDRPCFELWPSFSNSYSLFTGLSEEETDQVWLALVDMFRATNDNIEKGLFLRADTQSVTKRFENVYSQLLAKQVEPDEALRFKVMEPFRRYVMENYEIVSPEQYIVYKGRLTHMTFGDHVLFRLKESR
jgi:hypothetical protein